MSILDGSIFILYWMIAAAVIVGTVFLLPKILKKIGGSDEWQALVFIVVLCALALIAMLGYLKINSWQDDELQAEVQSQERQEREVFIMQAHPPLLESLRLVSEAQHSINKNLSEWQLLEKQVVQQKKLMREMSAVMTKENAQLGKSYQRVNNALSTALLYRQTGNPGHVDQVFVKEARDMDALLRESHAEFRKGGEKIYGMVVKRLLAARKPLLGEIKDIHKAPKKEPDFKFLSVYPTYLEYLRSIEPELAASIDEMLKQSRDSVRNFEKWDQHENPDYAIPIKQVKSLWKASGYFIIDSLNTVFGALEMEYIAHKVRADDSVKEMADLRESIRKVIPRYHDTVLKNREIVERSYGPHFSPK